MDKDNSVVVATGKPEWGQEERGKGGKMRTFAIISTILIKKKNTSSTPDLLNPNLYFHKTPVAPCTK